MARKGTLAGQKPERKVTIRSIYDMAIADVISHCRLRHPRIPYITRNEHEQMHRLRPPEDGHKHHTKEAPKPESKAGADSEPESEPSLPVSGFARPGLEL